MPRSVPPDLASVLLKRHECLRELNCEPQPKSKLVESLDTPRSTLDDIVRELENADLVEYRDGEWQLTPAGQFSLEFHNRYLDGLGSLTEAIAVINKLPRTTPVEARFITGAEVHVATSPVPDEVMHVFLSAVESATHFRGVTPLAMVGYADSFYRAATNGSNAQLEVVLSNETFERLQMLNPDATAEAIADEDTCLYIADVPVTFSLWIADNDQAGIIVYADKGIQGILINNTNDALDWANEQYNHIQSNAEPIDASHLH